MHESPKSIGHVVPPVAIVPAAIWPDLPASANPTIGFFQQFPLANISDSCRRLDELFVLHYVVEARVGWPRMVLSVLGNQLLIVLYKLFLDDIITDIFYRVIRIKTNRSPCILA